MSCFERMLERYTSGEVPWDDELPPPEVVRLIAGLKPGRALDLGCGYGRSSIYLAQKGWRVDGVDFIPRAIEVAIERASIAGVSEQIGFHLASVAELNFLDPLYDFALDIGCMHALAEPELDKYADELRRLLRPNALYLLFARLSQPDFNIDESPRGLAEVIIKQQFSIGFELEQIERGETAVPDQTAWDSAWFYYRRLA